ncbi:MAG: pyridoxamine 5'-phosphate oxidase family protein [Acidimicrobiales bacterium]|nr:pyridoxamine 5'-phosphate oxidase family protein [Acidimicrobiales bacterium]
MATLSLTEPGVGFSAFVTERHLAILTLVRSNGRPHSTPVGFTWSGEQGAARVITWSGSTKVKLLEKGTLLATISQVDGGRWLTVEGVATVTDDPKVCRDAISAYADRYRPPKDRGDERRVILLKATRLLASASLG